MEKRRSKLEIEKEDGAGCMTEIKQGGEGEEKGER